jgi:hypothetical protein
VEYQEKARILCDFLWPDWRGCYVIFHIKPLKFGHVRAHIIVYYDDEVLSTLLCWDDLVSSEVI